MVEIIDARVRQKVATEQEWINNSLPLLDGEAAIVRRSDGMPVNLKFGYGNKKFSELPYFIQYDQAAFVPVTGNTLPSPLQPVAYSLLTEGTYTKSGQLDVVIPSGKMGVISWDGNIWSLTQTMELPMQEGVNILNPTGDGLPKEKAVADWVKPITENAEQLKNLIDGIVPTNGYVRSDGSLGTTNTWRKIEFPVNVGTEYIFDSSDLNPNSNKLLVFHNSSGVRVGNNISLTSLPVTLNPPAGAIIAYATIKDPTDTIIPTDLRLTSDETVLAPYISGLQDKPIMATIVKDSPEFQQQLYNSIVGNFNFDVTRRMSYTQLKDAISSSSLKAGEMIIVTGAPGGHTILISANTANSINENVQVPTLNYDYYKIDLSANKILAYDNISCVCRNTDGVWGFINNSGHVPKGFSSVTAPNSTQMRITYIKSYTKVISMVACPDETYAVAGVVMGPSVGLDYSDLNYSTSQGITGEITEVSGTLTVSNTGFREAIESVSFNAATGNITVVHSSTNSTAGISIMSKNHTHRPVLVNSTVNSIVFRMYDNTGNPVLSNTGMSFQVSRVGVRVLNNTQMGIAGSNIWIQGLMMTEIS